MACFSCSHANIPPSSVSLSVSVTDPLLHLHTYKRRDNEEEKEEVTEEEAEEEEEEEMEDEQEEDKRALKTSIDSW